MVCLELLPYTFNSNSKLTRYQAIYFKKGHIKMASKQLTIFGAVAK